MNYIKKLLELLSYKEKKKLLIVFLGVLFLGILEIAGIGSIIPFLAVASEPELIERNRYLFSLYKRFNFASYSHFLYLLGMGTILFIIFTNIAKAAVFYAKNRYTAMRLHSISRRLFLHYLSRPYSFYLNQNSAELSKNILSDVSTLIFGALIPILDLITHLFVSLMIIGMLMIVNPGLAVIIFCVIGLFYGAVYVFVKKKLRQIGEKILSANKERYKTISEAIGGIKELKILGRESFYLDAFTMNSKIFLKSQITSNLIGSIPQYILEIITYSLVLTIVLYLIKTMGDFRTAIPVIGLYAFSAQRLKPHINSIFNTITTIKTYIPVVEHIHDQLSGWKEGFLPSIETIGNSREILPFEKEIILKNISFRYEGSKNEAINDLSLSIKKNTTIGLVGPTGCGKTTLVDIILTLLDPQQGNITIDGRKLDENNKNLWKIRTGYVPQQIYLCDNTIKKNIAFGIPEEKIDMNAAVRAAEIANIHSFISEELHAGYDTLVGERGVRLSGGQRQRIGIARALYHNPEILIMDEATSALDGLTEAAIMEAIRKLSHKKTIIMIAHRLTTVRECDEIFILEKGKIKDRGKYEELKTKNENFKKMAEG